MNKKFVSHYEIIYQVETKKRYLQFDKPTHYAIDFIKNSNLATKFNKLELDILIVEGWVDLKLDILQKVS